MMPLTTIGLFSKLPTTPVWMIATGCSLPILSAVISFSGEKR